MPGDRWSFSLHCCRRVMLRISFGGQNATLTYKKRSFGIGFVRHSKGWCLPRKALQSIADPQDIQMHASSSAGPRQNIGCWSMAGINEELYQQCLAADGLRATP